MDAAILQRGVSLMREIADARAEAGLTQTALSELVDVGMSTIIQMQHGQGNPRIGTMMKVLAACGKTLVVGDFAAARTQESVNGGDAALERG